MLLNVIYLFAKFSDTHNINNTHILFEDIKAHHHADLGMGCGDCRSLNKA